MDILPEFRIIDEGSAENPIECEWQTFIEGKDDLCLNFATKAVQVLRDFDDPLDNDSYDCIAHLCDKHIERGFTLSKGELNYID
jgi:hypothetical protein